MRFYSMENMEIYNRFAKVPENAQKTIQAGRIKGMTDINPMWRIKCLTEQFGACGIGWYYTVKDKWLETVGNEIVAFVDIELYIKVGGEWSKPILGNGGSKLATQEKSGVYVSDECYKMATTDAISVACKQLGIGADVYWQGGRSKYSNEVNENTTKSTNAKQKVDDIPNYDDVPRDQNLINSEQVGKMKIEMLRTGATEEYLCKYYGLQKLIDMSVDQWNNCMEMFKKTPDRKNS